MVKVILFDFDGTIADSFDNFLEIIDKISIKYNLPRLSREDIEKLRAESARSLLKKFKIPFYKIPFLARDMKKMQGEEISEIKPFKGLSEVLKQLQDDGLMLGIITSNGENNVRKFLKKNKLNVFDYIHADTSIFGKTQVINNFLNKNKLSKDNLIYVGDEIRDIEACRKAGVKIASVTWGFNSKEGLIKHNPDFIIDKPTDLLKLIEK